MKIAVYTALYGEKDYLRPPLDHVDNTGIDYFVFTDNENIRVIPYKTVVRPIRFTDITKNARYFKIMGDSLLQGYDYVLWHDANIQMQYNGIYDLIEKGGETYLTTFVNPFRDDFYSEAMSCIRVNKDFSLRILKQALVYFFNGLPAHFGLCATGIIVKNYKHHPGTTLEFWWQQTLNYSRRDQLSLAYTMFKNKVEVSIIRDDIFNNAYSKYHPHRHNFYEEKNKVMSYNFWIFKKISFYGVKLLRKIKKAQ